MINSLLFWILFVGCVRTTPVSPVVTAPMEHTEILDHVRAIPSPAAGKVNIQMKGSSKTLNFAGSAGGALLFDRPKGAKMELLIPFIGPIFSATYDGTALSVLTYSDAQQRHTDQTDHWTEQATSGMLTTDEVFGLLLGDLPMKEVTPSSIEGNADGTMTAIRESGSGHHMLATVGSTGFLQGVTVLAPDRTLVLSMAYDTFTQVDKVWIPKAVTLNIPQLTLEMTIAYKGEIIPVSNAIIWDTQTPRGFTKKEVFLSL